MARPRLSDEVRRQVIRLAARGKSYREIIELSGVSMGSVTLITKPLGGVIRPEQWQPSSARLSLEDRVNIRLWLEAGESFSEISRRLGRAPSTVSREVGGRNGRVSYAPVAAHRRAGEQARRPKTTLLGSNDTLRERVICDLQRFWSPEQIVGRLVVEFPSDLDMRVSHETIYKSLFIEGRGELKRELAQCLRTGRAQRQPRGGRERRGQIPGRVPISDRPPEVADRAVPGHWEGDLIVGSKSGSAVGTLVERTSRYTMLLHLPDDHGAAAVREAATAAIYTLPDALKRSLTWDQGLEMAQHRTFTIETGVQVYFCDPRSPWQRPTNENTNGLLRQYLPKGKNLKSYSVEELEAIADALNQRPRKVLGFMTPSEKFAELIATTG